MTMSKHSDSAPQSQTVGPRVASDSISEASFEMIDDLQDFNLESPLTPVKAPQSFKTLPKDTLRSTEALIQFQAKQLLEHLVSLRNDNLSIHCVNTVDEATVYDHAGCEAEIRELELQNLNLKRDLAASREETAAVRSELKQAMKTNDVIEAKYAAAQVELEKMKISLRNAHQELADQADLLKIQLEHHSESTKTLKSELRKLSSAQLSASTSDNPIPDSPSNEEIYTDAHVEDDTIEQDRMPLPDTPEPLPSTWSRVSNELTLTKRYAAALNTYYGREGVLQDTNSALKMLEGCASDNHLAALTTLAVMAYCGWHANIGSRDRGTRMLMEASDRGEVIARQMCYRYGLGCEKDESRVLPLLMKAETDNPIVMFFIAECHLYGVGTFKQPIIGMQWMLKAVNSGLPAACFWAGVNYQSGVGVKASTQKSMKNFRRAAERCYPAAMTHLAMAYEEGCGVAKDAHQAMYWYTRAAECGDELATEIVRVRGPYTGKTKA